MKPVRLWPAWPLALFVAAGLAGLAVADARALDARPSFAVDTFAFDVLPSAEYLDAVAAATPPEAPEPSPEPAGGFWWFLSVAWGALAAVVGWLWNRARERLAATRADMALQAVEAAAHEYRQVYEEAMRRARADHVVTNEEVKEAVREATARAAAVAKAHGVDLLKYYAKEFLPVLFERIFKREATGPLAGS